MKPIHPTSSGFTLVESLMAVTFLAVLFLAVAQTSSRASDAFDESSAEHALSTATHRGLERLAAEVEFATTIDPALSTALGASTWSFRTPTGFAGGAVLLSDEIRLELELEPGEVDDGHDGDGDELVDERRIVRVQRPGAADEQRTVLVSGVAELLDGELPNGVDDNGNLLTDEAGLSFSADGNVVTIRLTCQRRDEGGRLLTRTATTSVRLYNAGG